MPTFPPPGPSLPSPYRLHGWFCLRSCLGLGVKEVEELLLSAGEFGVDESGVATWSAAAAGLQCAQMKMLKPRPLQMLQIEPLPYIKRRC